MKKIISFLLFIVILINSASVIIYGEESDEVLIKKVNISINNDAATQIDYLVNDNIFYVSLDDFCNITRSDIKKISDEIYTISHGLRKFSISISAKKLIEVGGGKEYNVKFYKYNSIVYVPFMSLLSYFGGSAYFDESSNILKINFSETLLEVLYDYEYGYTHTDGILHEFGFNWSEIYSDESTRKVSNICSLMEKIVGDFDLRVFVPYIGSNAIEQSYCEDALLKVLQCEGINYLDIDEPIKKTIFDLMEDQTEFLVSLLKQGNNAYEIWNSILNSDHMEILSIFKNVGDADLFYKILSESNKFGHLADKTMWLSQAAIAASIYSEMTNEQLTLLEKTLLTISKDSSTYKDFENMFLASEIVSNKIKDEWRAGADSLATNVVKELCEKFIEKSIEIAGAKIPYLTVAKASVQLGLLVPPVKATYDKAGLVMQAEFISGVSRICDINYGELKYNALSSNYQDTNILEKMKYNAILKLKSSIQIRENWLEILAIDNNTKLNDYLIYKNKIDAWLLRRLQEATINPTKSYDKCAEDINQNIEHYIKDDTNLTNNVYTYASYIGVYSNNWAADRSINPDKSAGYDVTISNISNGLITFSVSYIGQGWSPIYETGDITAPINENVCEYFNWTDSWENKGHGSLQLENGNVIINLTEDYQTSFNMATLYTSGDMVLYPDPEAKLNEVNDNIDIHIDQNESNTKRSGNISGNIANMGLCAQEDNWIYYMNFSDECKLYKMNIDGSNNIKICDDQCTYINVIDGWIYYSDAHTNSVEYGIYKIRIDGTDKQKIYDGYNKFLNVVGEYIYFSNGNGLYKMCIDGTNLMLLSDYGYGCSCFSIDNSWIYFVKSYYFKYSKTEERIRVDNISWEEVEHNRLEGWEYCVGEKLYKIRIDGSEMQELCELNNVDGDHSHINVTDGWIYYCQGFGLYKLRTDGSEHQQIVEYGVRNINIINGWIYYYQNSLNRMKIDGSEKQVVFDSNGEDSYDSKIYIINDKIYYYMNDGYSDFLSIRIFPI